MPELFIHCGSCHCRMFSNVPGLCTLDACNNPPSDDYQNCLQTLPNIPQVSKMVMPVSQWFRDLLCVICGIASKSMRLLKPHQTALLDRKVFSMKQWKLC